MSKEYIEQRNGGYYIAGKRISLDSVVHAFRRGASPESILRSFPLLTLEEIYGAITYYLSNHLQIDKYLARGEEEYEKQRQTQRAADPEFYKKMDAARSTLHQEGTTRGNP
jgi:uncharacterized protein (DUF433 family)